MSGPPEVMRPLQWERTGRLPALGLIPAGSFDPEMVLNLKQAAGVPVHLVFPLGSSREAGNLRDLLMTLQPLPPTLIDQIWIAFGGQRPEGLRRLTEACPQVKVFPAARHLPPDQQQVPLGKGSAMRALLYHLVVNEGVSHPRTVVAFIDADIRPAYFHPRWVVDPVGALLWFHTVEAAKIVYQRPHGGRLNTMLRSLLALCPHPGVQALQRLAYLLSGEMAGTLKFWTRLPFKTGYGVETLTLLSLALDHLGLDPGTPDLEHLVQVYVGQMDHRHAPLTSTPRKRGLDQMAGTVFHTLMETLVAAGLLRWQAPPLAEPRLAIPVPDGPKGEPLAWMEAPLGDVTLPPLASCPEVQARLASGGA
jgi:glucosyl-3-phosphoglycerate synthase